MFRRITLLATGALFLFMAGCTKVEHVIEEKIVEVEPEVIAVTSVTVTPAKLQLAEGTSAQLSAKVEPANATDAAVKWSCNAENAIVDSEGNVYAMKEGTATVTATAGGKSATCAVTIVSTYVPVTAVTLDHPTLTIVEGETADLTATVKPDDASNNTVFWTCSDETVAIVSGEGKVGGLKPGTVTVTATADGKSATCAVTIERRFIPVTHVWLDQYTMKMTEGDSIPLAAEVEPEDATDPTVTWTSSNEAVVTVEGGVVTAIAEGTATITATAGEKSAVCEVTVYPLHACVDLGLSVLWGTCNLGATVPEEFGNYYAWGEIEPKEDYSWATYKWCEGGLSNNLTKYNTSAAYGYVVDHKEVLDPEDDAATVMYGPSWRMPTKAEWQELLDNCNRSEIVMNEVKGLKFTSKKAGYTDQWIFFPYSGYYDGKTFYNSKPYLWSSTLRTDSPNIAWCYYDYYLYNTRGRCFGHPVRPVKMHGYVPVESVTLSSEKVRLILGKTAQLTATVTPAWATNGTVTWKSSNSGIASVVDGLITAVAEGTVTVTATADGVAAICEVIVEKQKQAEAVDLGLSVKWASFNVGANADIDIGDYYAWGETEPKPDYSWATYKFCWGTSSSLNKYNQKPSFGDTDSKTVLDPEDDVAHVKWGAGWRMPTADEWKELVNNTSWYDRPKDGVQGYQIVSKKTGYTDKYIFLPKSGYYSGNTLNTSGRAFYWSSSLNEDTPSIAWYVENQSVSSYMVIRSLGLPVRPVTE